MLVQFSIANFKSFLECQTLDMLGDPSIPGSDKRLTYVPKYKLHLRRLGVLYGKNGSGKSNLFKSLQFLKKLITGKEFLLAEPFKHASEKGKKLNTEIDIYFLVNSDVNVPYDVSGAVLYHYHLLLSNQSIEQEVLEKILDGENNYQNKEVLLRRLVENNEVKELRFSSTISNVIQYKNEIENIPYNFNNVVKRTCLSLIFEKISEMDKRGEIDDNSVEINKIFKWFDEKLELVAPYEKIKSIQKRLLGDKKFQRQVVALVEKADTGILNLSVEEAMDGGVFCEKELKQNLLREWLRPQDLRALANRSVNDTCLIRKIGKRNVLVKRVNEKFYVTEIKAVRGSTNNVSRQIKTDILDESDGNLRLIEFAPILMSDNNNVFFVDEIDRSLHSTLLIGFLRSFIEANFNMLNPQLICSIHQTDLLDESLVEFIRVDEVHFVEMEDGKFSKILPLLAYAKDLGEIEKRQSAFLKDSQNKDVVKIVSKRDLYLHHRFGGTPNLPANLVEVN